MRLNLLTALGNVSVLSQNRPCSFTNFMQAVVHSYYWSYLHQFLGMLSEDAGVVFRLPLIAALGRLDEYQQGHVGLQEGVRDMVTNGLPQLVK